MEQTSTSPTPLSPLFLSLPHSSLPQNTSSVPKVLTPTRQHLAGTGPAGCRVFQTQSRHICDTRSAPSLALFRIESLLKCRTRIYLSKHIIRMAHLPCSQECRERAFAEEEECVGIMVNISSIHLQMIFCKCSPRANWAHVLVAELLL